MSSFINNLSPQGWEDFCEVMLRQHFRAKNFYSVPDQDGGDLGIEFYTVEGTIFQCYYPEPGIAMSVYKKKIQKKINDDLKKLKDNEKKIAEMLDGIVINHWVLLTPEYKSRDFIAYCNKKKKEVIKKNISYIDAERFSVKIETASTYPDAKLYAQGIYPKAIDIPLRDVTDDDRNNWKSCHSQFSTNVTRKSTSLMGADSGRFQDLVVTKYIQIEKFLDQMRTDHPDLYNSIDDSARAQLDNLQVQAVLTERDQKFVQSIVDGNQKAFCKHSKFMSDKNMQSLAFGYLSKWLAECFMDFDS